LRPYQEDAIDAWVKNGYRGLFEMATGTGKTITSLEAACTAYSHHGQLALIVLVPYLHLANQWVDEAKAFGFSPIICSSANSRWKSEMIQLVDDYSLGTQKHICLIAVHQTASRRDFRQFAQRIDGTHMLLLADETHALGARHLRKALLDRAEMRLSLSATPDRWLDEEGTAFLREYYSKVVFDYPLEKAIGTFLTPYEYHPILVSLMPVEADEYAELTQRIAVLAMQRKDGDDESPQLKHLLIKRARILWKAEQKYLALQKLLRRLNRKGQDEGRNLLKHLLLYCAPGEHMRVLKMVRPLIDSCHRFVHDVKPKEREKVLTAFERGDLSALVAIKCLDEGVDIPATRTAVLMASTSNPREFVQRRGRVLRKHEGKKQAVIYDFLVLPPEDDSCSPETARSLLLREMPRFAEFASCASNQYEARQCVRDVVYRYGMLHLLDMRPWELQKELLRERGMQLEQQFTDDICNYSENE
jgi:superfamily II DNA or RNA helicase